MLQFGCSGVCVCVCMCLNVGLYISKYPFFKMVLELQRFSLMSQPKTANEIQLKRRSRRRRKL